MESVKFKKGDSALAMLSFPGLSKGKVYVVEDVYEPTHIRLLDDYGQLTWWYADRFEKTDPSQHLKVTALSTLVLPADSSARKEYPMTEGLLDYFPAALAEVSRVSKKGNDQHNPGQPMHHARGKSMDHPNCIVRHLVDRGGFDTDGLRHSAKLAWRALALLQEELEAAGAPLARGAKLP